MSENNSLALISRADQALMEADTVIKLKDLQDMALTAADWLRRKNAGEEIIRKATSLALEAERKMGTMLIEKPPAYKAGPGRGIKGGDTKELPFSIPTLSELGLTKRESSEAQMMATIPRNTFENIKEGKINKADVRREIKRESVIAKLEDIATKEAKEIKGLYDVVVIDPPWPMEKIERDVRPNQSEFDYPTMSESDLESLEIPVAEDCHVWLWTTQKFLPMAFRLLNLWGLKYVCTFVWHKKGGFQPYGLPQYNCEFSLYARKGSPQFIETKAFPVCFDGVRGAHSEKPEEFYGMVCRVTAGRRLDMFSRREIEGFVGWGQESK